MREPTFTVSVLIAQYRAFLDGAVRTKQLPNIIFLLLFVQHPDKQLPVVCTQFDNKRLNALNKNNDIYYMKYVLRSEIQLRSIAFFLLGLHERSVQPTLSAIRLQLFNR